MKNIAVKELSTGEDSNVVKMVSRRSFIQIGGRATNQHKARKDSGHPAFYQHFLDGS